MYYKLDWTSRHCEGCSTVANNVSAYTTTVGIDLSFLSRCGNWQEIAFQYVSHRRRLPFNAAGIVLCVWREWGWRLPDTNTANPGSWVSPPPSACVHAGACFVLSGGAWVCILMTAHFMSSYCSCVCTRTLHHHTAGKCVSVFVIAYVWMCFYVCQPYPTPPLPLHTTFLMLPLFF